MTRVKICGITAVDDAREAASAGADAIGLVFAEGPRRIDTERAREIIATVGPFVTPVALFVNSPLDSIIDITDELGIRTVQLHGDEPPEFVEKLRPLRVIKAVGVAGKADLDGLDRFRADALLLDARVPGKAGGTGQVFDWSLAVEPAERFRVILAGGLHPDNVADAVRQVRPYAVDVSSGVESSPGRKDPVKVRTFIERARSV